MRNLLIALIVGFAAFRSPAREISSLASDWRFQRGEVSGADQMSFDDSAWQKLSIPHSWGWEEAQRGTNYYRGPAWYRRDLNIAAPQKGKRYFIRFQAAGSVADVYLNGRALGQHRGAFGAFCFEITKSLVATGTNVLAVRVSNAAEPDIAPLSGDFCVFGGLYRPVELIETSDVNFTLTDHAAPGVAWLQTKVSDREATLEVTAQISNGTRGDCPMTLVATVFDVKGKAVAEEKMPVTLKPAVTVPVSLRLKIRKPHLWNGRKDPYLYRAVMELRADSGVLDFVEQPLGLRYYAIDKDRGFSLNGRPYHLHGVNRHQDRFNQGWAISPVDEEEDVALIRQIGATVVRCSHYQQSDYFVSLCDKAGILVWAEIPQVDKVGADPRFAETSRNQLLDLIRQNVNHPSIFAWSLFNELRPGNPDPHRLLQDLNSVAHGEDPTRPTIAATCAEKLPQMNLIPDWLGWNIYPGWYSDWAPMSEFGKVIDDRRFTSREGALCISEYGAGANVGQHQENPPQPKNDGQWHPEEYQNTFHEIAWAELKARPYVWGTFVWCMYDFSSFWRHEGGLLGRNDKGLVTYDRKTKKDAFYFYKANWNPEPMVYITSRRFAERTNAVTDVKVYSNAKTVELLLNGASLGKRSHATNCVFVWKGVQLKPGENRIQALAAKNLKDECVWTLSQNR
ncbi:MAG TPA: glycoside hydrolase family 2 TIM barrel-domain containing protein [Candidatus Paceibacterota bacterium]|nr:glycoside hydrolase family 2 TIM barrel-domain containing protein [Candidatus Paceibacterota bacterium]